jgi:hypothetical protein
MAKAAPKQSEALEFPEPPAWTTALKMVETDEDVSDQIGERIMGAETVDDVLGGVGGSLESLDDYIGKDITVYAATLRRTNLGIGVYAVMDCGVNDDSERVVISCGASNVLRQLVRIAQLEKFPFECQPFKTASKSNANRNILWLGRPDGKF